MGFFGKVFGGIKKAVSGVAKAGIGGLGGILSGNPIAAVTGSIGGLVSAFSGGGEVAGPPAPENPNVGSGIGGLGNLLTGLVKNGVIGLNGKSGGSSTSTNSGSSFRWPWQGSDNQNSGSGGGSGQIWKLGAVGAGAYLLMNRDR